MYKCVQCDYQVEEPTTPCPKDGSKKFTLLKKEIEHKLVAYQCSDCKFEFVIICLNDEQWKSDDNDPSCPKCGDDSEVHEIDCIDLRLIERVQQYELTKSMKILPE